VDSPAEVVLRLLVLKHMRNWSYQVLEREVRTNLLYRDFTRVGGGKVPDAKTMGRWGLALGPAATEQLHDRIVQIARAERVVPERRMRIDTTVVETNTTAGAKLRDRTRSCSATSSTSRFSFRSLGVPRFSAPRAS